MQLTKGGIIRLANVMFGGIASLTATTVQNEYDLQTGTWFVDGSKFLQFFEQTQAKLITIRAAANRITFRLQFKQPIK